MSLSSLHGSTSPVARAAAGGGLGLAEQADREGDVGGLGVGGVVAGPGEMAR